jgi:DNA polymerase III subunit epsilon
VDRPPLIVLRPSGEELAEHDRVLQEIVKATKGLCLWIAPPPPAETPAG